MRQTKLSRFVCIFFSRIEGTRGDKKTNIPHLRVWNKLAKRKKAGQLVEDMELTLQKKPAKLTKQQRIELVGQKRGKNVKNGSCITRRGGIITAEFKAL